MLDGMDVSRRIRDKDVTSGASQISVHPRLRAWMVAEQRTLGQAGGVVMEGRDIGTAVFPDAEVKIFLDAAPEVRGNRRYQQLPGRHSGSDQPKVTEAALISEMRERDERDRNRAESPLKPAADAILLDSTNLTLAQVLVEAERIVREHLPVPNPHPVAP
jgi:cytidylate kinase